MKAPASAGAFLMFPEAKKMHTLHFTLKYIPFTHHGTIGYTLCDNSGTVCSAFIKSWYNIHMYP